MNKSEQMFYMYRYRAWDKNVWNGPYYASITPEQIEKAWGEWEFCDETKYNEILEYIAWKNPCHYQAEKIACSIADRTSFSPTKWIEGQIKEFEERRTERREETRNVPIQGANSSLVGSAEPFDIFTMHAIGDLAESVVRGVGSVLSGTADVAGSCVKAIGDGISEICD